MLAVLLVSAGFLLGTAIGYYRYDELAYIIEHKKTRIFAEFGLVLVCLIGLLAGFADLLHVHDLTAALLASSLIFGMLFLTKDRKPVPRWIAETLAFFLICWAVVVGLASFL